MAKVKIYTTSTCQYCKATKQYFKDNNVDFEEIDVTTDENAQAEMIEVSGQMSVPVILVETENGRELVLGFDQAKLAKLLGLPS